MISITLKEKKEVAENTPLYIFHRPKEYSFLAGQYVSMKTTNGLHKDQKGDFRSFSIASAPYQEDVLEFSMRRGESAFKKNLDHLEIGGSVEITPAVGKCVLQEKDLKRGVVFLVGGIGVTPARSILLQANFEKRLEKFFLLDSGRYPESTPFMDEFSDLHDIDLTTVYTMTDQKLPGRDWSGERTRIDIPMIEKYVTINLQECMFFVVGLGVFVRAMREMLLEEGVLAECIFSDDFGGK